MLRKVNDLIFDEEKRIYVRFAQCPNEHAKLIKRIENKLARKYVTDSPGS